MAHLNSFRPFGFVIILALLACVSLRSGAHASWSADFNSDGNVDGSDFITWNANKYTNGGFTDGDANLDGYVGIFGDMNVLICQSFGGAQTGSTATVSANYNPTTGIVDVNISPDSTPLGVSGLYLVNTTGSITGGGVDSGATDVRGPGQVPFYAATAESFSETSGPFSDTLGLGSTTGSFTVPTGTPVSDLEFFYQRAGFELQPMLINDTVNVITHTPTVLSSFCSCVPEPTGIGLMGISLCGLFVRRRR